MHDIEAGRLSAGGFSGMSSAECNHFFMVRDSSATEDTIVMTDGKTLLLEIRATWERK